MKAYLINMHLLVPRSRSSAKVKVKYKGYISQKMAISGAFVFYKHILFFPGKEDIDGRKCSSIIAVCIFSGKPYEIVTTTSDVSSAGTSANVYIQLYGKDMCTQQKDLCISKLERKDKFKRNQSDTFVLEVRLHS